MRIFSPPPPQSPLLEDSTSSAIISASPNPTASNSVVSELPAPEEDDQAKILMRRLLISIQKSNRSRKALEIFESDSRNTDGASRKQLKKRPMFLDPPDDCHMITGTRRKKKPFNQKVLSSSSSTGTGPISSHAKGGRTRAMSPCPPVPPAPHQMIDLQQGLESTFSSFDAEEHDLLMLEPIELSAEVVLRPEIEPIEIKRRSSQQQQQQRSSNYHDSGSTTSWKQTQEGRRRAMSACPPSPPAVLHPHQMTDFQRGLESIDTSSFDGEENNLLMLEPIELSEVVLPPDEIENEMELKKRLSHEQRHAHQQQPQQGCFRQMRSFHIRDLNNDNHSAIQYQHHHHPQHHHQHFAVTMHHHHQFQNHNPRYYPNTYYPENDNAAAEFVARRNGWSWSFQTGMRY